MSYKSQHIVILGSGLAGLFSAAKLAEAGIEVTVVHARTGQGEASPLAQGVICSKGLTAADSELFAAKLAGQEALFSQISRRPDIARIQGVNEPFSNEEECERLARRVYRQQHFSEFGTERKGNLETNSACFARDEVAGWLFYPRDYWFDAEDFLAAFKRELIERGVRFVEDEVVRFEESAGRWRVVGKQHTFSCDELVVAAGAATDALLMASKFPPIGLIAVHGVILRGTSPRPLPSMVFVRGTKSVVCYDHKIQMGGTSAKEWREGDLARHVEDLQAELLPFLNAETVRDVAWQGLHGVRVRVKDRLPVVGPWTSSTGKSIFVLTGLYKNGLQLGEACAEHLVRCLRGLKPPVATRGFDARRLI